MQMTIVPKEKIERFINLLKLVKVFNDEISLVISENGVHIGTMDPSHVAMIWMDIPTDNFSVFEPLQETFPLSINLAEMLKMLDRADPSTETLALSLLEKENQMKISFGKREIITSRTRDFFLKLLEATEEETPNPKLDFKGILTIKHKDFDKAVKDASIMAEHLALEMREKEKTLFISAKGDLGEYHGYAEGELQSGFKIEGTPRAMFTLAYLQDMTRALGPLTEELTLSLTTDMPCQIEAKTDETIRVFLAPCIGVS